MTIAQTIIDGLNFYERRAVRHKARMEQRRERYLNPPDKDLAQRVPHPATFVKPADRKRWPDFLAKLALACEVSLDDAAKLCSFRHGAGPNRFNYWQRKGDEKQTTRRRAYRDSEAGIEAAKKRDGLYRAAVRQQSREGIARMADLAAGRI